MSNWREFLDPAAPPGGYLPWREVARRTSLSRTTAWRLQKRGEFPTPYAISPGRVAYREGEVEAWRVSREHGGERRRFTPPTRAPAAEAMPPAAAPVRPPAAPVTSATPDPAPPAPVAAAPRPTATAASPAKRAAPGRRRSQHAQAIAQQMRFDF